MANPGGKLAAGESPEELVDLLAFALGFFSFIGADGEAVNPKLLAQGKQVATQMKPRLDAGLVRLIEPLVDRPDAAQLRTAWNLARRGGTPADTLARTGEFTVALAGWLRSRPQVLRDVFAGGRAFGAARRLQNAAEAGSPQSMLAQLSTSAPASRLRLSYKWLEAAAVAVGAEPSPVEKATVEGEAIGPVVDAIRKVQSKIDATPPDSEEAADLNEERSALEHELEVAIETSSSPAAVQQVANSQLSAKPSYGVEQRFGVNDQQAQAVLAEGRIVLAAGAGSGKTKTMVAKIEYAVRDQGYDPEQILATSFTRKAAGELGKRLQARGVQGVRTGTTHSISREIIVNGAPALKGQLDKGVRNADTIFRLAIEQVALSERGGGGRRYAAHDIEAWGNKGWGGGKSKGWSGGKGGGGGSPYWKEPAGLWFNIGKRPMDAKGRVLGSRRLRTVVGLWQNSMVSPDKAWEMHRGDEKADPLRYFGAAVYGAYDWLKKNDPSYGPALDLDDWLSKAVEVLETNKPYREAVQRRYRMVIVDEAQDQNMTQHKLFGILGEKADTYAMVGDDKQCVAEGTQISLPDGRSLAVENLQPGDQVLSYRNGAFVPQTVRHVVRSSWTWGYEIEMSSGRKVTMSPTHKQWASHPSLDEDQNIVYLMHRRDLGFRVGVTSNGRDDSCMYLYGQRPVSEGAEKFWVLDVVDSRAQALRLETKYSLQYGVPTLIYHTNFRKTAENYEETISGIFAEFGKNGTRILEERHLSFDHPHWIARTFVKKQKYTVQLVAHGAKGTQVCLEVGPEVDLTGFDFKSKPNGARCVRKWFTNYRDGLLFARTLREHTGALLAEHLSTPEGSLRMLTAAGLFPGMELPVAEDFTIASEEIVSIRRVDGLVFYDLDVDDASNFLANQVVTSNSIYEFRGAAPQEFVTLPEKGFQLLKLTMNYRSGQSIVNAANRLIAYNEDRQIPMVCDANVDRKGMGEIRALETASHESSASFTADEIESSLQGGGMSPNDFGIMVRNNAEADAFALALMARGIPFRCKRDFFNAPAIKSMLAWMMINVGTPDDAVNDAVTQAHMTPGFFLDREFAGGLARECPRGQNYLQFLLDDGRPYTGQNSWRNAKMVVPYANVLRSVADFEGDSESLVRFILDIEGPKAKFITSLMDQIDPDDLMDEADSLDITEEQIREAALAPLQPLFQMARTFQDPAKFMAFVDKMQRANSKTRKDDETQPDEPAVMIGTVHSWKGLEVKHAYVSMAGGVFPHHSNEEKEAEGDITAFDSERRLAYVAITRGEDSVTVLSPKTNYLGREAKPSRFISEACIGWVGETKAAPSDGTDEDPLRKQGSDRGFFSADFGEDLVACLGAMHDDDSWLGIYGPDSSDPEEDVLERLYFGLGEES